MIVWITGLSGAGKTTLATEVISELRRLGRPVVFLDGDSLRDVLDLDTTNRDHYSRENRLALALRYSRLCHLLSQQNFDVVIATISLFSEVHAWNRQNLEDYFEVYLDVPLSKRKERDIKEIYANFDEGIIKNVAGLDLDVDIPLTADWSPEFDPNRSAADLALDLLNQLSKRNLV